jgi:hypothetical protein
MITIPTIEPCKPKHITNTSKKVPSELRTPSIIQVYSNTYLPATMPLWTIYHPPSTFTSPSTKSALARAITSIYTAVPLPAFYVNVLFQPIEADSFYIGGVARPSSPRDEAVGPDSTKPFIRITIQNIARTLYVTSTLSLTNESNIECKGSELNADNIV